MASEEDYEKEYIQYLEEQQKYFATLASSEEKLSTSRAIFKAQAKSATEHLHKFKLIFQMVEA